MTIGVNTSVNDCSTLGQRMPLIRLSELWVILLFLVEPPLMSNPLSSIPGPNSSHFVDISHTCSHPFLRWIADGLASHLEDIFIRKFLGLNELAYRYART